MLTPGSWYRLGLGPGDEAVYDPVGDRLVVVTTGYDWVDSWSVSGGWFRSYALGTPPLWRKAATSVYDDHGKALLIFGGQTDLVVNNDTWRLSLEGPESWTRLFPAGTAPSARKMHSAIYDPVGNRMIVFGGADGNAQALSDVHQLLLGNSPSWSSISPAGVPPDPRNRHVAIYDPRGPRMIVFGGFKVAIPLNDVWSLSLGEAPAWSQLSPNGTPPPTSACVGAYDPVAHEFLVFEMSSSELWVLSLVEPLEWSHAEIPEPRPPVFSDAVLVYDSSERQLCIVGNDGIIGSSEMWAKHLPACPPPVITSHPMGQTVSAGSTVVFEVVDDGLGSRTYRWRRNGRPLVDDGRRSGSDTATLTVSPAGTFDAGSYDVVVREACATTVSAIAELTVIPPTGVDIPSLPASLILDAPAPNPASRAVVSIVWAQPRRAPVLVSVYDIFGHEVARLADTELEAGRHERTWVAGAGSPANPAGIYFVRVRCDGREITRKVTVLE